MITKHLSSPVADAHAKLAAAILVHAVLDAKNGDREAAVWLADPEGGLFFCEALGYDLPLERWARRIEADCPVVVELRE